MRRAILNANTSNIPLAAAGGVDLHGASRWPSISRDPGYPRRPDGQFDQPLGRAVREVSSRLEEMPAEEGYPAYLSSRLAEFYERGAAVQVRGLRGTRRGR